VATGSSIGFKNSKILVDARARQKSARLAVAHAACSQHAQVARRRPELSFPRIKVLVAPDRSCCERNERRIRVCYKKL